MRAKLANLNNCAESFLSRADANLCWYYIIIIHGRHTAYHSIVQFKISVHYYLDMAATLIVKAIKI